MPEDKEKHPRSECELYIEKLRHEDAKTHRDDVQALATEVSRLANAVTELAKSNQPSGRLSSGGWGCRYGNINPKT